MQEEFYKYVLTDINNDTVIEFIDNVLEPYSDAYNIIQKAIYTSTENAEKVNNILRWLNRIDNSDWLPPANDDSIYGESIELSASEQNEFISELNSDIYKMTGAKRNYLILRLDAFLSDGAASYKSNVLSIEHILPQTVSPGSEWDKTWTDVDDRPYWLNKIGNLIPLTKRHNSKAQIQVIKTISENDIKARILRIPAKIKERIPESMTSYTVTFNGATVKELTIAKERDYFAKATDLYKKYGLIDTNGTFVHKQITWSMDESGTLSATIK